MEELNVTVSETQLKGRRTSLGKKTNEELINIILRKDKTERNNSAKIKFLNESNFDLLRRIDNYKADMTGMEDKVKTKQETIDNLTIDLAHSTAKIDCLIDNIREYDKEVNQLRNKCNLFRRIIFTCLIVLFMIILIIIF